ncbi:MAG: asparagine synthase-related protein [Promethearchaeota archaeon]
MHSLVATYCKKPEKVSQIIADMISFSDIQHDRKLNNPMRFMAANGNFGIGAINLMQNTETYVIQPLKEEKTELAVIFDGEIYNKDFFSEYLTEYSMETDSDAELIFHLFKKVISSFDLISTLRKMILMLEGVYVFIILWHNRLIITRDPIGVRPLYFVKTPECILFSSQRKPLLFQTSENIFYEDIQSVHQGRIYVVSESGDIAEFRGGDLQKGQILDTPLNKMIQSLEGHFRFAIKRRLTDHEEKFGVLYSGGLDSSILTNYISEYDLDFCLYTSGFQNSPDLEHAMDAFSTVDATLKINELSLEDFEAEIPRILFYIEKPEIMQINIATPVHFSTLLAKNDDVHLLFSGQGLDEIFGGYARHVDTVKSKGYEALYEQLWKEFETFPPITLERDDALSKAHRTISRMPFLDQRIVEYAMKIPASFKVYNIGKTFVRKWIVRKLAENLHLPKRVYKRKKVAMQFGSGTATALGKIAQLNGFDKPLAKKCGYRNNQQMYLDTIACLLGFPFRDEKRTNLLKFIPEIWKDQIGRHLTFMHS